MRKNTDARARGGAAHSSEESLVMREEPRGGVIQSSKVANPQAGMSNRTSTKPYAIAKRAVWEAYQQVKANRGSPPEGRARWTVRLVAEEAVKRKLVPRVG